MHGVNFGVVLSFLRKNKFILLQSDKEEGFVVATAGVLSEKALAAINENFDEGNIKALKGVKATADTLCSYSELAKLAKSVKNSKKNTLELYFSIKTPKVCMPFRVIFTERHSCQWRVG